MLVAGGPVSSSSVGPPMSTAARLTFFDLFVEMRPALEEVQGHPIRLGEARAELERRCPAGIWLHRRTEWRVS
jgi:hypothetical protein